MNILGISAFYHDSAACLVRDGVIVAAAQEERFTRVKHDWGFPHRAAEYCLREGGISVADLDIVVFYDKPFLKFERILETHLAYAPFGLRAFIKAMPVWIKEKIWVKQVVQDELGFQGKVLFPEHHESHAASAFYPSPFQSAAFLTTDGVGEWTTTSYGVGKDHQLSIQADISFPHSLGLLYSAFTYYTGFKVNSGEYKLMGLAPYGEPKYKDLILKHLIEVREDGSFRMDMNYFSYCAGLTMTNSKFDKLFGGPRRSPETPISQREMDLARSVQEALEEIMLKIIRHIHKVTGEDYLCLAGGVALNCVANGRLLREGPFKDIWIQPASSDAGGALGAALYAWHHYLGNPRKTDGVHDTQRGSLLGPEFRDEEIGAYLNEAKIPHRKLTRQELVTETADLIAGEKVVAWFQGRMEFGPRALGARSILGDARSPKLQETMNLKIKFRESFRPFAPIVKRDRVSDYFELDRPSPYMMLVAPVKASRRRQMTAEESALFGIQKLNVVRSDIPAVTHVDYSARIQTVDQDTNPLLHDILCDLEKRYDSPVIINTSFNVRGEPIVCTPQDAYRCFMRTHMDTLIVGSYRIDKADQPKAEDDADWKKEFELD
jgi:carbamoyltransferase